MLSDTRVSGQTRVKLANRETAHTAVLSFEVKPQFLAVGLVVGGLSLTVILHYTRLPVLELMILTPNSPVYSIKQGILRACGSFRAGEPWFAAPSVINCWGILF